MDTSLLSSLDEQGKEKFESAINSLQGEVALAAARLSIDPRLRLEYSRRIKAMSDDYRAKANIGLISWEQAAKKAHDTRNLIMETIRTRSTPLGQAIAEKLKLKGKTLNELIANKTIEKFGKQANFNNLSDMQKNQVYASIVESAGRSSAKVDLKMERLSSAGKGLIFLSIAIAIYEIYTAQDKVSEATRQAAIAGSGIAGGWAAGAVAGLACGPGAPACILIGGFVGGALAAWEMGRYWR